MLHVANNTVCTVHCALRKYLVVVAQKHIAQCVVCTVLYSTWYGVLQYQVPGTVHWNRSVESDCTVPYTGIGVSDILVSVLHKHVNPEY